MTDQPVEESGEPEPAAAASSDEAGEDPHLGGSAGDDVSGVGSVSGVGGEELQTENPEAGLRPVHEQGEKLGWGKDEREQTQPGSAMD